MEGKTLKAWNAKRGDVFFFQGPECDRGSDRTFGKFTDGENATDINGRTMVAKPYWHLVSRASDTTKTWADGEGWSEWTSETTWDTGKYDVQMECIDGIHRVRTRTRPRQPVQFDIHAKYGKLYPDAHPKTHRISVTFDGGDPDCASIKMEPLS